MRLLLLFLLAVAVNTSASSDMPLKQYTPGAINPRVRQDNIQDTICVSGYTKTVRPPSSYTSKLKKQQLATYYKGWCKPDEPCEEDHLISLELGGHPSSPNNLFPQANYHAKDVCENRLHALVCIGKLSLAEAQQGLATDWKEFCSKH